MCIDANDVCSSFECHAVHLRHVRVRCVVYFVLFLTASVTFGRCIFKQPANSRQRTTRTISYHWIENFFFFITWAEWIACVTSDKVAFVVTSPLWRENCELNLSPAINSPNRDKIMLSSCFEFYHQQDHTEETRNVVTKIINGPYSEIGRNK